MIHNSHKKQAKQLALDFIAGQPGNRDWLELKILKLLQNVDDLARFEIRPELCYHRKNYVNFDKAVNALRRLFEIPSNDLAASYSFAEVVTAVEDDYKEWEIYVSKK